MSGVLQAWNGRARWLAAIGFARFTPLRPRIEWKRIVLGYWLAAIGVFLAGNFLLWARFMGAHPAAIRDGITTALVYGTGYGVVFLVVPLLAWRRVRMRARSWVLLLLAIFVYVNLLFLAMDLAVCFLLPQYCALSRGWLAGRIPNLPLLVLISISLLGYGAGQSTAARLQRAEIQANRVRADLAQTRLAALNAQLQPHFLFNALQSVVTLLHRDPDAARLMLDQLAELLRRAASADQPNEVPLHTELDTIALYTGIESIRFRERLVVRVTVSPGLDAVRVPHLVLQPIVENAIRYAVARRETGCVEIVAALAPGGGRALLQVTDNGAAEQTVRVRTRASTGLENVRRRLEVLYGGDAQLTVERIPAGGTRATISFPFHPPATGRPAEHHG
ncbi:MAG TPA: histidine kinase [Longimicrobium sp.]|jgi:two-component sensor histidine kinase